MSSSAPGDPSRSGGTGPLRTPLLAAAASTDNSSSSQGQQPGFFSNLGIFNAGSTEQGGSSSSNRPPPSSSGAENNATTPGAAAGGASRSTPGAAASPSSGGAGRGGAAATNTGTSSSSTSAGGGAQAASSSAGGPANTSSGDNRPGGGGPNELQGEPAALGTWLPQAFQAAANEGEQLQVFAPDRTLRQSHYSIRLRICCEVLLFLGCIHLGIFPDWWNGVTNIGIAILLLVSVVLLAFLNALVQMIAFVSLLKIEILDPQEAPKQQVLFIAYIILVLCDTITMLVTGNASAMLLRDVLQIILRQEQQNQDLENPLLAGATPVVSRGPQSPVDPTVGRPVGDALQPFSGRAFKLDEV
ncbi:unnamed protein product [Amoebophrya sp. A25]|nr:unnamed protein product [Amoebophrya sp. A25]|eukprot:GSA25T00008593001.1